MHTPRTRRGSSAAPPTTAKKRRTRRSSTAPGLVLVNEELPDAPDPASEGEDELLLRPVSSVRASSILSARKSRQKRQSTVKLDPDDTFASPLPDLSLHNIVEAPEIDETPIEDHSPFSQERPDQFEEPPSPSAVGREEQSPDSAKLGFSAYVDSPLFASSPHSPRFRPTYPAASTPPLFSNLRSPAKLESSQSPVLGLGILSPVKVYHQDDQESFQASPTPVILESLPIHGISLSSPVKQQPVSPLLRHQSPFSRQSPAPPTRWQSEAVVSPVAAKESPLKRHQSLPPIATPRRLSKEPSPLLRHQSPFRPQSPLITVDEQIQQDQEQIQEEHDLEQQIEAYHASCTSTDSDVDPPDHAQQSPTPVFTPDETPMEDDDTMDVSFGRKSSSPPPPDATAEVTPSESVEIPQAHSDVEDTTSQSIEDVPAHPDVEDLSFQSVEDTPDYADVEDSTSRLLQDTQPQPDVEDTTSESVQVEQDQPDVQDTIFETLKNEQPWPDMQVATSQSAEFEQAQSDLEDTQLAEDRHAQSEETLSLEESPRQESLVVQTREELVDDESVDISFGRAPTPLFHAQPLSLPTDDSLDISFGRATSPLLRHQSPNLDTQHSISLDISFSRAPSPLLRHQSPIIYDQNNSLEISFGRAPSPLLRHQSPRPQTPARSVEPEGISRETPPMESQVQYSQSQPGQNHDRISTPIKDSPTKIEPVRSPLQLSSPVFQHRSRSPSPLKNSILHQASSPVRPPARSPSPESPANPKTPQRHRSSFSFSAIASSAGSSSSASSYDDSLEISRMLLEDQATPARIRQQVDAKFGMAKTSTPKAQPVDDVSFGRTIIASSQHSSSPAMTSSSPQVTKFRASSRHRRTSSVTSVRTNHSRILANPSLIQVTSANPDAAARAAAILKVHHAYIAGVSEESEDDEDQTQRESSVVEENRLLHQELKLYQSRPPPSRRSASAPRRSASVEPRSIKKSPSVPPPAATFNPTVWSKVEWRRLEYIFVEQKRIAKERGYDVEAEYIVDEFLKFERLSQDQCSDAWDYDQLVNRTLALMARPRRQERERSRSHGPNDSLQVYSHRRSHSCASSRAPSEFFDRLDNSRVDDTFRHTRHAPSLSLQVPTSDEEAPSFTFPSVNPGTGLARPLQPSGASIPTIYPSLAGLTSPDDLYLRKSRSSSHGCTSSTTSSDRPRRSLQKTGSKVSTIVHQFEDLEDSREEEKKRKYAHEDFVKDKRAKY